MKEIQRYFLFRFALVSKRIVQIFIFRHQWVKSNVKQLEFTQLLSRYTSVSNEESLNRKHSQWLLPCALYVSSSSVSIRAHSTCPTGLMLNCVNSAMRCCHVGLFGPGLAFVCFRSNDHSIVIFFSCMNSGSHSAAYICFAFSFTIGKRGKYSISISVWTFWTAGARPESKILWRV